MLSPISTANKHSFLRRGILIAKKIQSKPNAENMIKNAM